MSIYGIIEIMMRKIQEEATRINEAAKAEILQYLYSSCISQGIRYLDLSGYVTQYWPLFVVR